MTTAIIRAQLALLFVALALFGAHQNRALAAPAPPVITTPTPQPTPAPKVYTARELLELTPEAERHGGFAFFPVVMQQGDTRNDVNPNAFEYIVRPEDTLWSLALDFGRDLDTLSCATTPLGSDAEALTPGLTITVPALDDLCYTVVAGDTLAGIAARHGLTAADLVAVRWNGFVSPPYRVQPRQRVLLPGARLAAQPRQDREAVSYPSDGWAKTEWKEWPFGDGQFIWPVTGRISQYAHRGHIALDIAVPVGTAVKAADRGRVIYAGWSPSGYGFRVIIDHGIDYYTLYAHLSDIFVEQGQVVGKGQVVGSSGANGNVTGPHLHFEIRDFGRLVDPLPLLPR